MSENKGEIRPPEGTKILFLSASAFARKIYCRKNPIAFSGSHRGQFATIDDGYLIIDQAWFEKVKP